MIGTVLGTIGVVAAAIVLGWLADRRWHLLPRKELLAAPPRPALPAHSAGEAPSTAIRVTPEQIASLRRTQRCCRTVMATLADDEVTYDQRVLRILRFRCATCESVKSIYVREA